jgi:lysophospholipase L1-like esterase
VTVRDFLGRVLNVTEDAADSVITPTELTARLAGEQDAATAAKSTALRSFHAAAALRDVAPVRIAMVADSIQEGDGVTDYYKRPQSLLADRLLAHWPIPGMTTQGAQWIGGWQENGSSHPSPMVLTNITGSGYATNQMGLPRRALVFNTDLTAKWEMRDAKQMTSFDVVVHQNSGGGPLEVQVDGVAVGTVDTAGATTYSKRHHFTVAAGAHKVAIRKPAGGSTVTRPILDAVITYETADSYTKGFHVWDGAHSGFTVADFLTKSGLNIAADLAAIDPDLIVISLGANDEQVVENVTADQFYADLTTLIGYREGCAKKPGIVLMPTWKRGEETLAKHRTYVAKQYQHAAADPRNAILDLNLIFPDIADGVTNPALDPITHRGLYYDSVHPSNAGAALIADVLGRYLAPPA